MFDQRVQEERKGSSANPGFTPPSLPPDEMARVERLHAYQILDTAPEESFDRAVRIASALLGTPMALVSFVDEDRQWFKARLGVALTETSREVSFCGHAVAQGATLVVPDTSLDQRFAGNPLVTHAPDIRFYAGAPLLTRDHLAIGTICVLDKAPRAPSAQQLDALQDLAKLIMTELDLRAVAKHLTTEKDTLAKLSAFLLR